MIYSDDPILGDIKNIDNYVCTFYIQRGDTMTGSLAGMKIGLMNKKLGLAF